MKILRLVSIVIIAFVFFIGVYFMNNASSIIKTDKFKGLSYNEKVDVTSNIKSSWKLSILLLAILVCELLVIISFFLGKSIYSYENIVNIAISIVSIIILILLYVNHIKIGKYFKKINLK